MIVDDSFSSDDMAHYVATGRPRKGRLCEVPEDGKNVQGRVRQSELILQKNKIGSEPPVGVPAKEAPMLKSMRALRNYKHNESLERENCDYLFVNSFIGI
jgi:hypothetical protein